MATAIESTSPKISDLLVRSHLLVAAIGSGALLLTFLAMFMLRSDVENLAERLVPLDRTSVQLMSGVEESLAALRGWVSLEDPRFVDQWKQAWRSGIRPALNSLRNLDSSTGDLVDNVSIQQLASSLDDLEESQWWVKSVAQVPGNEPAAVLYEEQVKPVAIRIMQILDDLQHRIHEPGPLYSSQLMKLVATTQREFGALWQNVEQITHHGMSPDAHSYRTAIQKMKIRLVVYREQFPEPVPRLFELLERELNAFLLLVDEVVDIRQSSGWNRAQELMENETVPIAEELLTLVHDLSRTATEKTAQQVRSTERSITFYTWISVVLIVVVVLSAISLALQRSRSLSKPITALARAARAFASGSLEESVEATGSREIQSLGDSFNTMREQLSESQHALKDANEQLEERVMERTRELQKAKNLLEENAEHLRLSASVFEHSVEGIIITDPSGDIIDANQAFGELHGYARQEVIGQNPRLLKSGRHDPEFFLSMWHSVTETGHWRGEIWNRRKDGSVFPLWLTINDIRNSEGELTHYIGTFSDISLIKQSQEQLDFLAHHDPLTELPNRLLLLERLTHAISRAKREKVSLAVLFLDLDRFKQINDSQGHPQGDLLLQQVATRLKLEIRSDDTLARLGGDEFVLLLEGLNRSEAAGLTAQKLITSFSAPFDLDGQEVSTSASLGIALYPQDGTEPTLLLRNADAAMYRAKELGRNNYQFYTAELTQNAIERVSMENSLRYATERNELYLLYQPQVNLSSGEIIGVECLLRWQSPEFGLVSPMKFIPLAEETGLIHQIGRWVLNKACQQAKQWLDEGLAIGHIAVNISGSQIQRGKLVEEVSQILKESELPPELLELEVTEGFIIEDPDSAIKQLTAIREMGVALSVDDFGTGYSSLSYLKRLPIQKLKIDQSFVRDIPDDADDMAITDAVIAMGHTLGLAVIAEGVETEVQANFLTEHGCTQAQGYLFSKPITAAKLEELVKND
jgi:diguanylate cyclase (GGDEF)-like protein/PAS domain S-box-containing protein